jgi:uncharacterized membrane-anchored protein YitT (DUF2179 family)
MEKRQLILIIIAILLAIIGWFFIDKENTLLSAQNQENSQLNACDPCVLHTQCRICNKDSRCNRGTNKCELITRDTFEIPGIP